MLPNLSQWELSVAQLIAPPVAVVIAAILFVYVRQLITCIAGASRFRSRGFRMFEYLEINDEPAVMVGQDIWSTNFLVGRLPSLKFLSVPNDRLKFLNIKRAVELPATNGGTHAE